MNGMGVFACGASKISAGYKQYLSSRIRKVGCAEVRDFFFEKITENTGFAGRATVLGHIQRGGSPTANDRILATRMGDYAVKLIEEGKGGHCVGIIDNEIVGVPIDKALHEERQSRKRMYDMFDRLV